MAVNVQKCAQAMPTPAGAGSANADQDVCVKDELKDPNLDIGPTVLQPMDSCHRTNQQDTTVVKREDLIAQDGNDPMLCDRVEKESVVDKSGDSKLHSYTCDICQETFTIKRNFKYHITYAHASKSYKCNDCTKAFKCEKYLNLHKSNMHSTGSDKKCNVCGKYVKLRNLKQHMVNVHSDKQQCKVCGETVKSEQHLHLHLRDVHGQQPASSKFPFYTCGICQKAFITKITYKYHITYVHPSNSNKCNECNSASKCESFLNSHKRNTHSIDSYKKCHVCGKYNLRDVHGQQPANSYQKSTCSKFEAESGESTHPTVRDMNALASASKQQQDVVAIKEEPADGEV